MDSLREESIATKSAGHLSALRGIYYSAQRRGQMASRLEQACPRRVILVAHGELASTSWGKAEKIRLGDPLHSEVRGSLRILWCEISSGVKKLALARRGAERVCQVERPRLAACRGASALGAQTREKCLSREKTRRGAGAENLLGLLR